MTNVFFYYPDQHFMAVFTQVDDVEAFINFCSSNIEKDMFTIYVMWSGGKGFRISGKSILCQIWFTRVDMQCE